MGRLWGKGVWWRRRLHTHHYTVTTRMTSALRWAVVRAILMFHHCERQSHKTVSTDHNFWRERRAEADSNRGPSAYQPNALPLGQTSSPPQYCPIHSSFIHCYRCYCACRVPLCVWFGGWLLCFHYRGQLDGLASSYSVLMHMLSVCMYVN